MGRGFAVPAGSHAFRALFKGPPALINYISKNDRLSTFYILIVLIIFKVLLVIQYKRSIILIVARSYRAAGPRYRQGGKENE